MEVKIKRYKSGKGKGSVKTNNVVIDKEDTWDTDWTIAQIAVPLLKQLQETKHGAPLVADEDVPEELRSTSCAPKKNEWDVDDNHFKRWDFVLQEMIFAMSEIANDKEHEPPYHTKCGDVNFLPVNPKTNTGELQFVGWESTPESETDNRAYNERIQNGCRLFGLHFQDLWD